MAFATKICGVHLGMVFPVMPGYVVQYVVFHVDVLGQRGYIWTDYYLN